MMLALGRRTSNTRVVNLTRHSTEIDRVGCPCEHGGWYPFYMGEFHVLIRDLCIRYGGTLSGRNGRFISPIASLHESPRVVT